LLHSSRASCAVAAINTEYEASINAVAGGHRQDIPPRDQRREHRSLSFQGRSHNKIPGPYKDDSEICYYHFTYGNKARKCKPSYLWKGNGQATGN
jgi:hypothetical protein